MSVNKPISKANQTNLRTSALIAGFGLLTMAILGGYAIIGGLDQLIDQSSAEITYSNLTTEPDRFRLVSLSVLAVAILDIVVALALLAYFKPAFPTLAKLAAGIRILYASIFFIAITSLFQIWPLLGPDMTNADHTQLVFQKALRFYSVWEISLGIFGLHLLSLGVAAFLAPYTPKWIGILLAIAGTGYVIDTLDGAMFADRIPDLSTVTFIGEVVFMLWLLFLGRNTGVKN